MLFPENFQVVYYFNKDVSDILGLDLTTNRPFLQDFSEEDPDNKDTNGLLWYARDKPHTNHQTIRTDSVNQLIYDISKFGMYMIDKFGKYKKNDLQFYSDPFP